MTATVWTAKNTLPADQLGRCVNVDEVVSRYGEDTVRAVIDGYLTADDLALEVLDDFVDLPGASGRKMFQKALDEGIESVDNPPESLVRLFKQLDSRPDWVDDDQLRRGSIAYFRPARWSHSP